jgi:hypothetical protein
MRNWADPNDVEDVDIQLLSIDSPPGLGAEEVGGAYMTVSQRASEREHRQHLQGGSSANS